MYGSDASGDAASSSRATNRLRAMRDAKRQAATAANSGGRVTDGGGVNASNSYDRFNDKGASGMSRRESDVYSGYGDGQNDMGRSPSGRSGREMGGPERRMARPRVGLPAQPRGRG